MKYADINRRYTEIVAEYIGKGYAINSASMGGSQGETCKVDLTDGSEIIRVMVVTFSDWENHFEGVKIVVGKATDKGISPHNNDSWGAVWNSRLEILSTERFYKIGEDRHNGTFYGSMIEAEAAVAIKRSRYIARETVRRTENITDKYMELAKRVIRRKFGVQRIREADVLVSKCNGVCTIGYRNKTYRLR